MKNKKLFLIAIPIVLLLVAGLVILSLYLSFLDVKRGIEGLKQVNGEQAKEISQCLNAENSQLIYEQSGAEEDKIFDAKASGRIFRDEKLGLEITFPTDFERRGDTVVAFGPKVPPLCFEASEDVCDKLAEEKGEDYAYTMEIVSARTKEEVLKDWLKDAGDIYETWYLNIEKDANSGLFVAGRVSGVMGAKVQLEVFGSDSNYVFDYFGAGNGEKEDLYFFRNIAKTIKEIKK